MDAPASERMQLVMEALNIFPLSTEAWQLLGGCFRAVKRFDRALEMYRTGVTAARKLDNTLEGQTNVEWGILSNRPYLRALWGEMKTLHELGDLEAATDCAINILALNPNDNQGIRSLAIPWLIQCKKYDAARNVLSAYPEFGCSVAWDFVLLNYISDAPIQVLEAGLHKALEYNNFV